MNRRLGFVKTTIVGGIVFLVPVVILVAIIGQALQLTREVAVPFAEALRLETVSEVIIVNLLALLLIVAVCFCAGLLARTRTAARFVQALERRLLERIPAYGFVKGAASSLGEATREAELKPIEIRFDDYAQIAFEVERLADGSVVAYLPGSPIPWSGSVRVVEARRVTSLEATMLAAAGVMEQLGRGDDALLRPPPAER